MTKGDSNSEADAAEYQRRKHEDDDWGDFEDSASGGGRSEKRRLASVVSVRFGPDEVALLRSVADDAGETLSSFVRQAALAAARGTYPTRPSVTVQAFVGPAAAVAIVPAMWQSELVTTTG